MNQLIEPFINSFAFQLAVAVLIVYVLTFWFAMLIWTWRDIRARSHNIFVAFVSVLLVLTFNVPGLIIYWLIRPRETIAEAYERTLEEESLLQEIEEQGACPKCKGRVDDDFLLCPNCRTRLKKLCTDCGRQLHLKWNVCPFCAREVPPVPGMELTTPLRS